MKKLIIIAGPTASGKTEVSLQIAAHYKTEIISADSRQFYRQMNIGTAKPTPAELEKIPHHMIDSLDVTEKYNVGKFESDAISLIEKKFESFNHLVMTGGSGLYIDAVCKGVDDLPENVPEIREELNRIFKTEGIGSLQKKLLEQDPEYYSETDINNPHRIIRALEVTMIAGKKYSSLRKKNVKERSFAMKKIGLLVERDELYQRINKRVDRMIDDGLVDEVRSLLPYRNENALQTVGYKEIFDYLDNKTNLQEAIALIKQNTRNYAKRQMTWFRRDPEIKWFGNDEYDAMIAFIDG